MTYEIPEPLFEIVLTGWSNGEVTGDHMSFHGPHTQADIRALLTAYLIAMGPAGLPHSLHPQGAAA